MHLNNKEKFVDILCETAIHLDIAKDDLYLFGGALRDDFLQKIPNDYDFLFQGSMEELKQALIRMDEQDMLETNPPMEAFYQVHTDTFRTKINGITYDFKALEGRSPKDIVSLSLLTCETLVMNSDGDVFEYFGGSSDLKNNIIRINPQRVKNDDVGVRDLFRYYRYKTEFKNNGSADYIKNKFDTFKEELKTHPFHFIKTDTGKILKEDKAVEILKELNNTGLFADFINPNDVNFERLERIVEFRENHNLVLGVPFMMAVILPQDKQKTMDGITKITKNLLSIPDKVVTRRTRTMKQYEEGKKSVLVANAVDKGCPAVLKCLDIEGKVRFQGMLLSDSFLLEPEKFKAVANNLIKQYGEVQQPSGKLKL